MSFCLTVILRRATLAAAVIAAVIAVALGPGTSVRAQQGPAIAAIVNDQIISTYDLESRLQLALLSANLEGTPENRQRLAPQVLRQLIDERLQLQEAQRLNISVTDKEIADATAVIERQNNLPPGGLDSHFAQAGVPLHTLVAQIRANIAWGKVIRRQVRPQIEIGEDEIDDYLNELRARGGRTEYDVAEILLSADSFDTPQMARETAERLAEQARAGATFGALAQQFSQSPSAANGGELGRVQEGQLDPRLEGALANMQPGQISEPIAVENGFYILRLNNRRRIEGAGAGEPTLSLRQVFLPVAPGADEAEQSRQAETATRISDTATSCDDMVRLGREAGSQAPADPGRVRVSELPENLRELIAPLPVGEPTPPLRLDDGFLVAMVCERTAGGDAGLPAREEVMQSLGMQRIEMMARRYLRDLRRAAFVDVRL